MKSILPIACMCIIALTACSKRTDDMQEMSQRRSGENSVVREETPAITEEAALEIAKREAKKDSEPLSDYKLVAVEEPTAWRVVFQLKDKRLNGGGPKYRIDKVTGEVVEKKYTQ